MSIKKKIYGPRAMKEPPNVHDGAGFPSHQNMKTCPRAEVGTSPVFSNS
jgi:hypothetical protein